MALITNYENIPKINVRKRLNELCNGEKYPFDRPSEYYSVFFPEFFNDLIVVSPPPERTNQYNCFAYALGLEKWVAKYTFNLALENKDLIEIGEPVKGDIVAYFAGDLLMHAGRYLSDSMVTSKWAGGPIFCHATFMCPASYGNVVKYYKKVPKDKAEQIFNNYPVRN